LIQYLKKINFDQEYIPDVGLKTRNERIQDPNGKFVGEEKRMF